MGFTVHHKSFEQRPMIPRHVFPLLLCVALAPRLHSADAAAADEQNNFFERNIRPVLAQKCYECHSAQSKKVKGGLLLDSKDATLQGGNTGPAVVPGKPEESLLIAAIRYHDKDTAMPP